MTSRLHYQATTFSFVFPPVHQICFCTPHYRPQNRRVIIHLKPDEFLKCIFQFFNPFIQRLCLFNVWSLQNDHFNIHCHCFYKALPVFVDSVEHPHKCIHQNILIDGLGSTGILTIHYVVLHCHTTFFEVLVLFQCLLLKIFPQSPQNTLVLKGYLLLYLCLSPTRFPFSKALRSFSS